MNTFTKAIFGTTVSILLLGCAANDCTKEITIPERTIQTSTGSSYYPPYQLEVPCDYVITPVEEQPKLKEFSYEVIQFTFTPDTGRNTARLEYKIKLNNLSNQTAKGFPILTTDADGVVVSGGYHSNSCEQIETNSSCIISYDKEFVLNGNIGLTKSIKLVKVEYFIFK
jgi:hypothetical protein